MEVHVNQLTSTHINAFVHLVTQATIVLYVSYSCLKGMKIMNEHVGDPCADNPCLNGGSCIPNDIGGFSCQCPPDFTGPRCEDRMIVARLRYSKFENLSIRR